MLRKFLEMKRIYKSKKVIRDRLKSLNIYPVANEDPQLG